MKKAPIVENLLEYQKTNPYSAHTPGHKGGRVIPPLLQEKWPPEIWRYDVTEITNLDNLHYPMGCIKEAQKRAAQVYNAQASYFLVNGTSVGIHAAILALAYNCQIFVPRNVHKAVYNGLILANAEPIYLPVVIDHDLGFPLGIEPEVLVEWIKKYPRCKTLMLTHPTYQGVSYKIEEIISLALAHGLQVIVDEAHGSHLAWHRELPPAALSLGAHIVVQSWHKTLPVLTQASVLHVGQKYAGPELSLYLNMLQTTSPSYLLLASLDSCQAFLAEGIHGLIEEKIIKIKAFQQKISSLNNIEVYQGRYPVKIDHFKLCLKSTKASGHWLARVLREKYSIYAELEEEKYCLLLLSVVGDEDFLAKLTEALIAIDRGLANISELSFSEEVHQTQIPQAKMLIREAFFAPKEKVSLADSLGRIAGDFIIKYPPGIPLIAPGEVIDERIQEILKNKIFQDKIKDGLLVIKE